MVGSQTQTHCTRPSPFLRGYLKTCLISQQWNGLFFGAVYVNESEVCIIGDGWFQGNSAMDSGGAIYVGSSNNISALVSNDSIFLQNNAASGGAIYVEAEEGNLVVSNTLFDYNQASIRGGAIYFAGNLTLVQSNFTRNVAGEDGLAIGRSMCGPSSVQLEDVYFAGNGLYCPIKLYQSLISKAEAYDFHRVCSGCSHVRNGVPAGVNDGSTWVVPVCENPPTGTSAKRNGTTTRTLTLGEGLYRDSYDSEELFKCYRHDACVGGDEIHEYCATGYEGACEEIVSIADTRNTFFDFPEERV